MLRVTAITQLADLRTLAIAQDGGIGITICPSAGRHALARRHFICRFMAEMAKTAS